MRHKYSTWIQIGAIQLALLVALRVVYVLGNGVTVSDVEYRLDAQKYPVTINIPREKPLRVTPLYNRPELVSDEELAMVLGKLQPRFGDKKIKPNFVEHALRIWTVDATFQNPKVMSGEKMKDFLLNSSMYATSWGADAHDLLVEEPLGVAIRYGRSAGNGSSVHHDHTLACLTEAGISLNEPVFVPSHRKMTVRQLLEQAIRDFQYDERETEWTALSYALWLPPTREWKMPDGRTMSFDMLVDRLIRGQLETGVCSGTHRLFTLMCMWRIDQDLDILSDAYSAKIIKHLSMVRDQITKSQFPDGHWPSNWWDGEHALKAVKEDEIHTKVICTGHHLEWLAIAPEELHPPKEVIDKAAKWCIKTTDEMSQQQIFDRYTFFSHVGNALALWRLEQPHTFWKNWESKHPYDPAKDTYDDAAEAKAQNASATEAAH
jgi:hypothetical protein